MNFSSQRASAFASSSGRGQTRTRAFSLLEVAIALVIFVFGALAIVRIFPGSLRVITTGANRQSALNLNRATMARVQSGPPVATYDVGTNSDFTWVDGYQNGTLSEPRAVLGSTTRGYSLPRTSNQSDVDNSALGSIRAVIGEGTTVYATNDSSPSLFVLTGFPVFNDSEVRVCEEENINGVTIDGSGNLDFSSARFDSGQSVSDTTNPKSPDNTYLCNTASTSVVYYVTYRYPVTSGGSTYIWGATDEPVTISTGPTQGHVVRTTTVSGAVTVKMRRQIYSNSFGSSANSDLDGSRGLVLLPSSPSNPLLFVGDGITPPRNLRPSDKVTVDYQGDWERILQEGSLDVVPGRDPAAPTTARQTILTAPFIEDHDTSAILTLSYAPTASNILTGIKGSWGEGNLNQDNQTTIAGGSTTNFPQLISPVYVDSSGRSNTSEVKQSRVTFDVGSTSGFTSRISYRTRDDWAQQLSVAAMSYKQFVPGAITTPPEPWRDYALDLPKGVLYFHGSEAGKSVMVTYSYLDGSTPVTLRNRLLTIDEAIPASGLPSGFSAPGIAAPLQLTDSEGNDLGASQLVSISSVRGASITVRTAWLDGSRYTQSFLPAMRAGVGAEAMP